MQTDATSSLNEMISAPSLSLVKYETPILVSNREHADTKRKEVRFTTSRDKPSSPRSIRQDSKNKEQVAEILDAILPPREYEEDGKLWLQPVSRTPATRLDVINLTDKLDSRLNERKAREIGICPIRRELYDQCFDELIRQETLNCVERGLLFLRVRDELRMTLAAYETLYDSGVAFGIRKALLSERGKMDIVQKLGLFSSENEDLRKELKLQEARHALMRREWEQQAASESRKLGDEIDLLRRANSQLKMYYDDDYPWYMRRYTGLSYRDYYLRRAMLSVNSTRERLRNILNYPSYRLPDLRLTTTARYNLYKKKIRNLSLE